MFAGEKINVTEDRAVLHVALRAPDDASRSRSTASTSSPRCTRSSTRWPTSPTGSARGAWTGHTGKRIRNVVNIGIGGSDLGPHMATTRCADFSDRSMTFRFVSNVDGTDFWEATHDLDPAETLFIIASKTFTTLETMTNARTARDWSLAALGDDAAVAKHFVAVSTNAAEVAKFGIDTANMFEFWDWVGGRYSYDSAIGLSLMIAIGPDAVRRDARRLPRDRRALPHRADRAEPADAARASSASGTTTSSAPRPTRSCPYSQYLAHLPAYLQQLDMESNGKSVDRDGRPGRRGRPARSCGASPARTASTRTTS